MGNWFMSVECDLGWVDTHCHLDAAEFGQHAARERQRAAQAGVRCCVLPAVSVQTFDAVRRLAHAHGDGYCLGVHPLYVADAADDALACLERALQQHIDDPHLLAVGEIGLDFFVPELCQEPLRAKQIAFFKAQLALARRFDLPVVLHSRRAVDAVHAHLRAALPGTGRWRGIAHAFSGSQQQAASIVALGMKLGFGGAATFERATRLRSLLRAVDVHSIVVETDAPDIAPQWLYVQAHARESGQAQGVNSPSELPRIGAVLAWLRDTPVDEFARATCINACEALPRLAALLGAAGAVAQHAH